MKLSDGSDPQEKKLDEVEEFEADQEMGAQSVSDGTIALDLGPTGCMGLRSVPSQEALKERISSLIFFNEVESDLDLEELLDFHIKEICRLSDGIIEEDEFGLRLVANHVRVILRGDLMFIVALDKVKIGISENSINSFEELAKKILEVAQKNWQKFFLCSGGNPKIQLLQYQAVNPKFETDNQFFDILKFLLALFEYIHADGKSIGESDFRVEIIKLGLSLNDGKKIDAFKRDLARIINYYNPELALDFLPEADGDFEDPFDLGLNKNGIEDFASNIFIQAGYLNSRAESLATLEQGIDNSKNIKSRMSRKRAKRYRSQISGGLLNTWNNMDEDHPGVRKVFRADEFKMMYKNLDNSHKKDFLFKYVKEFLEEDPNGQYFPHLMSLLAELDITQQNIWKLFGDPNIFALLLSIFKHGPSFSVAILTNNLLSPVISHSKDSLERLGALVVSLFETEEDLNDEVLVMKIAFIIRLFKDKASAITSIAEVMLELDVFPISKFINKYPDLNFDDLYQRLKDEIYLVESFDQKILRPLFMQKFNSIKNINIDGPESCFSIPHNPYRGNFTSEEDLKTLNSEEKILEMMKELDPRVREYIGDEILKKMFIYNNLVDGHIVNITTGKIFLKREVFHLIFALEEIDTDMGLVGFVKNFRVFFKHKGLCENLFNLSNLGIIKDEKIQILLSCLIFYDGAYFIELSKNHNYNDAFLVGLQPVPFILTLLQEFIVVIKEGVENENESFHENTVQIWRAYYGDKIEPFLRDISRIYAIAELPKPDFLPNADGDFEDPFKLFNKETLTDDFVKFFEAIRQGEMDVKLDNEQLQLSLLYWLQTDEIFARRMEILENKDRTTSKRSLKKRHGRKKRRSRRTLDPVMADWNNVSSKYPSLFPPLRFQEFIVTLLDLPSRQQKLFFKQYMDRFLFEDPEHTSFIRIVPSLKSKDSRLGKLFYDWIKEEKVLSAFADIIANSIGPNSSLALNLLSFLLIIENENENSNLIKKVFEVILSKLIKTTKDLDSEIVFTKLVVLITFCTRHNEW
ncbi:hypothetical protein ACFL21_00855, partial [Patescibacteria group bacterium]